MNWKFWQKTEDPALSLLVELLATDKFKSDLFSPKPFTMPDQRELHSQATLVAAHGDTAAYKEWARDAWIQIVGDLKKILAPDTTDVKLHQTIGDLRATLTLLAVSVKAQKLKQEMDNKQGNSSTPQTVNRGVL